MEIPAGEIQGVNILLNKVGFRAVFSAENYDKDTESNIESR